jgi:hypothetical protein
MPKLLYKGLGLALKNFISGKRTVGIRGNPRLMIYGAKSGVRVFWLCRQGCGGLLPNLGAFPTKHRPTNSLYRGAEVSS